MVWLIAIYVIFFTFLAWRRLDWAVMLIIFSLWSYLIRLAIFGFPSTLLEVMIAIVAVVWLIKNGRQLWQNFKHNLKKRQIARH